MLRDVLPWLVIPVVDLALLPRWTNAPAKNVVAQASLRVRTCLSVVPVASAPPKGANAES